MAAELLPPTSQLADQLAPIQASMAPWLWAGIGLTAAAAGGLALARRPAYAALCAAAALLGLSVLLDIDRDQRVGWEQDRFERLSTLRADELYYYLPDPDRVRLAACGHDNLAADFMYFRSLFFIYETADTRGSGDLIYRMYSVIGGLSPHWKEPQLNGPVLVSALSGEDRQLHDNRLSQAQALLHRSQQQFPDDFRFVDIEANLYWGAAVDATEDQQNARRMIELYGKILNHYPEFYRLHPDRNPYLEYASQPIRDRVAALADDWYRAQIPGYGQGETLPDVTRPPDLTPAQQTALAAFWDQQRQGGDPGVAAGLAAAEALWVNYRDSRRELRDRLLLSLNAPDYRAELLQRARAFCDVLESELQSEVLDENARPGKVLDYLRWTDVGWQTSYEILIEQFRAAKHRLPTRAEFESMAWMFQNKPGEMTQQLPAPLEHIPGPLDPCGWAYVYEVDQTGTQFRVRSHFANVYKTALKANRLLTVLDQTAAALGHAPASLADCQAYLRQKYPPGAVVPPPILDSFGEDRDPVRSPCGGQFDFHDGKLWVPADVQTWLALKKVWDKRPFERLFIETRPYTAPASTDPAAPPPVPNQLGAKFDPRPVEAERTVTYP